MHSKSGENLEEIVLPKGIKEWGNTVGAIQYILACHVSKNSHILDVGCNSGSLVYNLWQLGFHTLFGVDIDKSRIERGQSAYPEIKEFLRVYDGSKLPFEDETFELPSPENWTISKRILDELNAIRTGKKVYFKEKR